MHSNPPIVATSRLKLNPCVVHREAGRRPLLGCTTSRKYLEVSDESLYAADYMQRGATLEQIETLLRAKFGHEFDVIAFATLLGERGFIESVDGAKWANEQDARQRHAFLHTIPSKSLRFLRSPWLLMPSAAIVLAWLALLATEPTSRVNSHDMLLFERPGLNLIFVFGGLLAMAYLHELAHFFMARSYGIDATISFSHRFYMMVLHTDVSNAWTLPRRQKLAIFLAGIGFNLTAAAAFTLAATAWPQHADWLRYLTVLNTFPLVFQLFVFARTDLYHVALAISGERNLAKDSVRMLGHRVRRFWGFMRGNVSHCLDCRGKVHSTDPFCFGCGRTRSTAQLTFEHRSRRILTAWGVIQVLGSIFGFAAVFFLAFPALARNFAMSLTLLGAATGPVDLGEAALALALVGLQVAFLAYFLGRTLLRILGYLALAGLRKATPWILRRLSPKSLAAVMQFTIGISYPVLAERGILPNAEESRRRLQVNRPEAKGQLQ